MRRWIGSNLLHWGAAVGLLLAGVPVWGQVSAATGAGARFEVVRIHPHKVGGATFVAWGARNRFQMAGYPVSTLIRLAYLPGAMAVSGSWSDELLEINPAVDPSQWTRKELLDVDATVPERFQEMYAGPHKMECLQTMLRGLLAERFGLKVEAGHRTVPIYALMKQKSAVGLRPSHAENSPVDGVRLMGGATVLPIRGNDAREVLFSKTTMQEFASYLCNSSDRMVVDQTGLYSPFDFSVFLRESARSGHGVSAWAVEQLGLKLQPTRQQMPSVVVVAVHPATVG